MRLRKRRSVRTTPRVEVLDRPEIECDSGAPSPTLMATEHRILLSFFGSARQDALDLCHVIEFVRCHAVTTGAPNDEVLSGHPLWPFGLTMYNLHEVHGSPWVEDLRTIARQHDRAQFWPLADARHFVFTFKDSTLEAVATDVVHRGTFSSGIDAMNYMNSKLHG